ncbi:unnamed protein product [Bursaphelenchus xylophilus]|uniref:(pine wood nematode) hypothetical protein n=1 Tax=Bursaphelenchus xylophilus TaxID=6326 RepID=A0A1I7S7R4_BURXY|nr:unnamed protein product [Bursaphelenchus xylophilus]CAG9086888.1 unnamed protein product [Bursaphelenchus xylophilus]
MTSFIGRVVSAATPSKSRTHGMNSLDESIGTALSNWETELTPFSDDEEYTCQSIPDERRIYRKPQMAAATVRIRLKQEKEKELNTLIIPSAQSPAKTFAADVGPDMENMETESKKHQQHIVKTLKYEVMSEYNTKIRFHHFQKSEIKEFSEERRKHYQEALRKREKWLADAKKL